MKKTNPPLYNHVLVDTGNGMPVILLHGLFGNYKVWSKTVAALKSDFRVIVPRLPIFDLPIHLTNVKYLVKVLDEFIEWNELKNVALVGHALGGQVALMYTYTHPENVSKLVLTGSAGLQENTLIEESLNHRNIDEEYVYDMVSQAFHGKTPLIDYFTEEIYLAVQNIPKRLTIGSMIKSSKQSSVISFLNQINQSALLLWGLDDKLSPPEIALHFHDFLKNSELKFIKDCGHMAMMDQPQDFNQNLISFLKR